MVAHRIICNYFIVISLMIISCSVLLSKAQQRPLQPSDDARLREAIKATNVELDKWEPPEILKRSFPYYFAGYDYEDRPIWIFEFGKWDLKSYFENGGEDAVRLYEKYTDQFFYRAHNSPQQRPKDPNNPGHEWVDIVDMEGYNLAQLSSPKAVQQTLKAGRDLTIAAENAAYAYALNANYFGQALINIMKPILGGFFARSDVYGTNKDSWIPKVLKKIPRESLPEWYGGFKNFTPIAVAG